MFLASLRVQHGKITSIVMLMVMLVAFAQLCMMHAHSLPLMSSGDTVQNAAGTDPFPLADTTSHDSWNTAVTDDCCLFHGPQSMQNNGPACPDCDGDQPAVSLTLPELIALFILLCVLVWPSRANLLLSALRWQYLRFLLIIPTFPPIYLKKDSFLE